MKSLAAFNATFSPSPNLPGTMLSTAAPRPITGPSDGTQYGEWAGLAPEDVFTNYQLEQLSFRRYNPLSILNATTLSNALDSFSCGVLMYAARLWEKMCERDETLFTVKPKREESVSLREWVIEKTEESPEAKNQYTALHAFYSASTAGHALNRHTVGGVSMLLQQMMESVAYKYAVHHIIWQPNTEQTITLPSGATVPGLSATFEQVPLEFFEARTGELRFLGMSLGYTGEPLAQNNWLVTTGPGLMQCASTEYYLKRLGTHDLVELSGKWSAPAILGHTTANKESDQGHAMANAVSQVAANYKGVLYGAPENKIEFLWPQGGTSGTELPCQIIRNDVKRELVTLWLGSDLSTISRDGDSVGASLQGESTTDKCRADCKRISETLNARIDPIVIRWYFGQNARILVKFKLVAPEKEDRKLFLECSQGMVNMGAPVSVLATAKRLNVPLATEDEAALTAPQSPVAAPTEGPAVNVREQSHRAEVRANLLMGKLLARARQTWPEALAHDLAPLRTALTRVLCSRDSMDIFANAKALYDEMPKLGAEIIAANASSDELERILGTALANGLTTSTGISA